MKSAGSTRSRWPRCALRHDADRHHRAYFWRARSPFVDIVSMLTRTQYRLLNALSWLLGLAFALVLGLGVDRLHLRHWVAALVDCLIVGVTVTIISLPSSYNSYRRAVGDPAPPPAPALRPRFLYAAITGRDSVGRIIVRGLRSQSGIERP